jgi:hypothetical protein
MVRSDLDDLLDRAIAKAKEPMVIAFLLALKRGDSATSQSTASKQKSRREVRIPADHLQVPNSLKGKLHFARFSYT